MKKRLKTDKKVVHVEKEEVRYPEIEMMVRKRCPKKVNKLVMRLFYQSDPTRKGTKIERWPPGEKLKLLI